jgi:hypothetical protein
MTCLTCIDAADALNARAQNASCKEMTGARARLKAD